MGQMESKAPVGDFVCVHRGSADHPKFRSPVLDKLAALRTKVPSLHSQHQHPPGSHNSRGHGEPGSDAARASSSSTPLTTSSSSSSDDLPRVYPPTSSPSFASIARTSAAPLHGQIITNEVGSSVDTLVRWGRSNAAATVERQAVVHARIDEVESRALALGVRTNLEVLTAERRVVRVRELPALATAVDTMMGQLHLCVESYEALYTLLGESIKEDQALSAQSRTGTQNA
mmetsp:Transcript_9079/g.14414  ORF Transcript_9079/g.14414 Transcript_9079/m.14414 type:complete len:230 (+) Transcript_9079:198-887(+)